MKKTLLLLSAFLLAVSLLTPARTLAEDESVFIHIESVEGLSGEEIDLPVTLERCAGVDSIQFDINYDSTALQVVSMTPGDLFPAQYTVANLDEAGRIRIACASALGIDGAGTLLTLRFQALSDTGSAVTITNAIITRVDADYNQSETYVAIEDGGITIDGAAMPEAVVTPWIPKTPVPTPSPVPTPVPTPEATAEPAEISTLTQPETPVVSEQNSIPTTAILIIGGLFFVVILLIIVVAVRGRRNRS